jgi:hypothetical protein
MKFKVDRPLAIPEAAEQKLLEIANAVESDRACRLSVAEINTQFLCAGGSAAEHREAVAAAVAHGWIVLHPFGAYVTFTQAGANLFA